MKFKRLSTLIFAAGGMLLLILDSKTALRNAYSGIDLCIRTVIPSLFPFFVLSALLTGSLLGSSLRIFAPVCKLFRIPQGAESILLTGLLGGYPVGAGTITAAYRSGQLSRTDAERMLAFCNNAGPAFLFGMIGCMFSEKWVPWLLWGIHIFSALLVAILMPGGASRRAAIRPKEPVTLPWALRTSLSAMASVCGWVVIFRVVIGFLDRWILWLLPTWARVAVTGLLELSNGCCALAGISDMGTRFLVCSGILAFGGLCVTMQTVSVTEGLSLRQYIPGKLLQTLFSLTLSLAVLWPVSSVYLPLSLIGMFFCVLSVLFFKKIQKRNSISAACGV